MQYLSILMLLNAVCGLLVVLFIPLLLAILALLCLIKDLDEKFKKDNSS